jgi:hypothetical protein
VTGAVAGALIDPAPTAGELAAAIEHCLADSSRYARMSATAVARASRYTLEEWAATIRCRLLEAGINVAPEGSRTYQDAPQWREPDR